jgi:pyruvate dehydrogenase E2 component (dihydrolipoamide acetyltransferase)
VESGVVIALLESEAAAPDPGPPRRGMFARNREVSAQPQAQTARGRTSSAQLSAARRLAESKRTIPHFYLEASVNASRMRRRRESSTPKPVWDAFFVRAVAKAVRTYGRFAKRFADEGPVPSGTTAIGVAIDIDDELFVIGIEDAAQKPVEAISTEIRAGADLIREGDAGARKLPSVNLTISNLGGSAIERFTAIINPPESAILAIGRIGEVAVVVDGVVAVQDRASLTLSADHRLVNGKYAAEFLQAIIRKLEEESDE